jgi:alkylation response protein AidB-like acyl-CoA dehydrogenase
VERRKTRMDFELTEEQIAIKKAVREFCEKEFTPELALEFDKKEDFPTELYKKAAKLGFTSMRLQRNMVVKDMASSKIA